MFDIGWTELVVIGVVALIVIGPRDLPEMFRTLGRFTAKLRSMSRDFSRAMEAAAKESGVQDVARDLKSATSLKSTGLDAVKDAAARFEKWDPLKNAAKPSNPAAVGPRPTPAAAPVVAVPAQPTVSPPAVVEPPAPAMGPTTMGPETRALAEKVSARKAIAEEAAAKLRALNAEAAATETAATEPAAPVKKPGRTRKPKTPSTDNQA